jgi:carbonic anhydrase/acetyltransferase-like protein (isoleucine patch superfamily)
VIGRVDLAEGASVWYGAVLRGDNDWHRVGRNSNVQDGSVLHTDLGIELDLGRERHRRPPGDAARLHHRRRLAGRHPAVMLNGAKIGRTAWWAPARWSPRARNSPTASMIMGSPAKVVRSSRPSRSLAGAQRHALRAAGSSATAAA